MSDLRSQLENLSPAQRAKLAERVFGPHRKNRLLAFVKGQEKGPALEIEQIRQHLNERLPKHMLPSDIIPLKSVPRLPNGKIDRARLARPPLKGAPPAPPSSTTKAEASLVEIWQEVLGTDAISIHDNFFEIGGDSILTIQMISRARAKGLSLSPGDLAEHPTIESLAKHAQSVSSEGTESVSADHSGPIPLTPIQHWFFSLNLTHPEQWNQGYAFELDPALNDSHITSALKALVAKHEQLRVGFRQVAGRWIQEVNDAEEVPLLTDDAIHLHKSFRFDGSPLVRFSIQHRNTVRHLDIVAHHLVIDQVSWQMLQQDLNTALKQALDSRPIELSAPTSSFAEWAHQINQLDPATSESKAALWTPANEQNPGRLPLDHAFSSPLVEADTESITVSLEAALSEQLFSESGKAYQTKVEDLLFTALGRLMHTLTKQPTSRIGLERHGRQSIVDGMDVSQTIGWFTAFFPCRVTLRKETPLGEAIKSVKEQLRRIPDHGLSYGQVRYLGDDALQQRMASDEEAEDLLFNYLGNTPPPSAPNQEPIRSLTPLSHSARAPENRRSHLLEINSHREAGLLKMIWIYHTNAHNKATIETWADAYLAELRALIEHCQGDAVQGFTPSDFPDAEMSQEDLDAFLDQL